MSDEEVARRLYAAIDERKRLREILAEKSRAQGKELGRLIADFDRVCLLGERK